MNVFHHPELAQLTDQLVRYAPVTKRRDQWTRACQLLGEIETAKEYPYSYVVFRVCDYRADAHADKLYPGPQLQDRGSRNAPWVLGIRPSAGAHPGG